MASRNDLAFQRDFFAALEQGAALLRAIAADLPPGVVATARTDGESTFVFLQNYSAQSHTLSLPSGYRDCLTDAAVLGPADPVSMGLPYSPSPRLTFFHALLAEQAFFVSINSSL